ncbi:hypothetical protein DES53_101236 [Roseimicrobium gellanilyticum]|uniref:Uncharacterized protein n=1 Tax=Roseimicrobium gellanilyticum TaxID=748857 RepID=A0A366HUS9_9BACT|nr:hypothetical protein [Roseimicrobium gellanilyticum]RBP47439.1 hypothetical protein DES53_101236 [Roseimicrobium gellanilyticum]
MNESEFESGLRRFTPVKPSPDLAQGIATALERHVPAPTPVSRRVSATSEPSLLWVWLDRLLWSALGATAAIAVTMAMRPAPAPDSVLTVTQHDPVTAVPGAVPEFQKVLTSNEALDWKDEGIHFDSSGQPVLKLQRTAVEHQAWADLQNAGVVQVEVPRQEVMYVPVQLH